MSSAECSMIGHAPRIKQKGTGRPSGSSAVREDILDAAEARFANLGNSGTTLREVADAAKVTQALIRYYFKSKFGLCEAVFMRRGLLVLQQRVENLELLEKRCNPDVRDIVRASLLPTLALRPTPQVRAFLRLQVQLHTEPPEISYRLRTEAYGGSTRRYLDVLRQALPNLGELYAHWRMTLMFCVTGANRHNFVIFESLVDALPAIGGKPGWPHQWPDKLHADKGYDFARRQAHFALRGIRDRIARRSVERNDRLGRHRWVLERTHARLAAFGKLRVPFERRIDTHVLCYLWHAALVLLCHKSSFTVTLPQHGHRPSRSIS